MKLSKHQSRVLEDHLRQLPAYQSIIESDFSDGPRNQPIYLQSVRQREVLRITQAIEKVFNEQGDEARQFLRLLYFDDRRPTIEIAADQTLLSIRTAKRRKSEFLQALARELGWI